MAHREEWVIRDVETSLRVASDPQLSKIMQFIDRLPSRAKLEPVVERVRGRLALVRPARSMTPARVLTLPYEDLLVGDDLVAASPWYVPRSLIQLVTTMTTNALSPGELKDVQRLCDGRTLDDLDGVLEVGAILWRRAVEVIIDAFEGEAGPPDLPERHLHALGGIAAVLDHADIIVACIADLPPRPMPKLREDERLTAAALLSAMAEVSSDLFRYGLAMLVRRSAEPAEFFDMIVTADFGLPIAARDALLVETASECFHEVDVVGRSLSSDVARPVASSADQAMRIASLLESLESAPSQAKVDKRKLHEAKERASRSVSNNFQGVITGEMRETFQNILNPSDGMLVTDDGVAHAEGVARSTRKLEMAGQRLGAGAAIKKSLDGQFPTYKAEILGKASKVRAPRMARLSKVMDEIRLAEIVFGADPVAELIAEIEEM